MLVACLFLCDHRVLSLSLIDDGTRPSDFYDGPVACVHRLFYELFRLHCLIPAERALDELLQWLNRSLDAYRIQVGLLVEEGAVGLARELRDGRALCALVHRFYADSALRLSDVYTQPRLPKHALSNLRMAVDALAFVRHPMFVTPEDFYHNCDQVSTLSLSRGSCV